MLLLFGSLKRAINSIIKFLAGLINKTVGSVRSSPRVEKGINMDRPNRSFRGYRCQNCGAFFSKHEFSEKVDRVTSVRISKAYAQFSDEFQQYKPAVENPDMETTDYCPSCSYEREDIRLFRLVYDKPSGEEEDEQKQS